jgi:hypothetical protein
VRGSFHAPLQAMPTYTLTNVARQIGLSGFFVAGCGELDFLCEGRASEEERATWIKQIGMWEGWDVEVQPGAKVRFSTLVVTVDGSLVSHLQAA